MERDFLFKVIANGKEYCVFANGEVSGFDQPTIVCNHYPQMVRRELMEYRRTNRGETQS